MNLFTRQLFKRALWGIVALLLALPVGATILPAPMTSFKHQIGFDVNPTNGQLRGADLASIWTVRSSDELELFAAHDYRVDLELTNASIVAPFGNIKIEVLDSSNGLICMERFFFVIDDSHVPLRLRIYPGQQADVTNFVKYHSMIPAAIKVVLTLDVRMFMLDTNQEVRIQSCGRLNDTLVACDDARLPVFLP